jgi:hypothetical protein
VATARLIGDRELVDVDEVYQSVLSSIVTNRVFLRFNNISISLSLAIASRMLSTHTLKSRDLSIRNTLRDRVILHLPIYFEKHVRSAIENVASLELAYDHYDNTPTAMMEMTAYGSLLTRDEVFYELQNARSVRDKWFAAIHNPIQWLDNKIHQHELNYMVYLINDIVNGLPRIHERRVFRRFIQNRLGDLEESSTDEPLWDTIDTIIKEYTTQQV